MMRIAIRSGLLALTAAFVASAHAQEAPDAHKSNGADKKNGAARSAPA